MSEDPAPDDPSSWPGDAKIVGRAEPVRRLDGGEESSPLFRIDITEVVPTRVGEPADHLVIESWHPGRGLATRRR
jgi:hypothetical protein